MEVLDLLLLDGEDERVMSAAMDFIAVECAPTPTKRVRRKRKTTPGYSTEQGRRKKAEVLALRSELLSLEEWVQHLKEATNTRKTHDQVSGKASFNPETAMMAMKEFQRRQKSERINKELKAILASQEKVGKSILAVLQQTSALTDQEFVFNCPRTIPETCENAAVLAQLRDGARFLYMDQRSVVPRRSFDAYSCIMAPKIHPSRGKMFESSTVCSVPCSMTTASDALWREYSTPGKYADKTYRFMEPAGTNAVKKNFDLLLRSKSGLMPMNGLMFASKLDDANQTVMVRDYIAFLPTAGVHMRCHHWTIVTPSDSTHACHVHFFTQLFLESDVGFSATPKDMEYVQQVALEAWSTKMHLYSQLLHDRLQDGYM